MTDLKVIIQEQLSDPNFHINDYLSKENHPEFTTPKTLLMCATLEENEELVKYLLEKKADPNKESTVCMGKRKDTYKITPLIFASGWHNLKIMKLLVDAKSNINACCKYGTPLIEAVVANENIIRNSKYTKYDIVTFLLEAKADVNKKNPGIGNETALSMAIEDYKISDYKISELLLKNKANPNLFDYDGLCPISSAIDANNLPIIQLLIEHKANINISQTMVHNNKPLIFKNQKGEHLGIIIEESPLIRSLLDNESTYEIHKYLIDMKANIDQCRSSDEIYPVALAAEKKHNKTLKLLLDMKADLDEKIIDGRDPVFLATEYYNTKGLKLLLKAKANPNSYRNSGETAVYQAIMMKHKKALDLLFEYDAESDLRHRCNCQCQHPHSIIGENQVLNYIDDADYNFTELE